VKVSGSLGESEIKTGSFRDKTMSDEEKLPARTLPHTLVRGMCMDCYIEVAGYLAVSIVVIDRIPGVQIEVVSDDHTHTLGRVPLHLIPGTISMVIPRRPKPDAER
jgi:hypothetical protein